MHMQMITRAVTCGVLNGLGDIFSQLYVEQQAFDAKRCLSFTMLVRALAECCFEFTIHEDEVPSLLHSICILSFVICHLKPTESFLFSRSCSLGWFVLVTSSLSHPLSAF